MIYTCTFNPSLDYFMDFKEPVTQGKLNRADVTSYAPGGKGVNASIVLSNLGVPSKAMGFLGGFNKDYYIDLLRKYTYLEPRFTTISDNTRINVKISGASIIECNAHSPQITQDDMDRFLVKVSKLLPNDMFILSGTYQHYLEDRMDQMFETLKQLKVNVCVDSDYDMFQRVAKYHGFLALMSDKDAMSWFNVTDKQEIIDTLKQYVDCYDFIIVTQSKNRSMLICKDGIYQANSISLSNFNRVGVGFDDSILAGFVMNYIRSHEVLESFQFANACGQATLLSKGLATKGDVEQLYDQITIETL